MERIFLKIQMFKLKSIKFYVGIKTILHFKKSELVHYPWMISIVYFVYISMYVHIHSKKITIKAINTIIVLVKNRLNLVRLRKVFFINK